MIATRAVRSCGTPKVGVARVVRIAVAVATLAACGGGPPPREARGFWFPEEGRIVDLTRVGAEGSGARATTLSAGLADGTGATSGTTVDRIEPGRCVAPFVVIDVRARAIQAPEFVFASEDLAEFEARRGQIPAGALVVLATGGGQLPPAGAGSASNWLHPGFSPAVVEFLIRQRGAVGLGSDAPAIDPSSATASESARAAVKLGAYVLTNLARLDQIAAGGAILLLTPSPEPHPSTPVRVFALAPRTVGRVSR